MTSTIQDSLLTLQNVALAGLKQSLLLQTSHQANVALQQLKQSCFSSLPYSTYNQRPKLMALFQQLPAQLNCSLTELIRLLMLKLITGFSLHRLTVNVSSDISSNYLHSIQRIYQYWGTATVTELQTVDDSLLKDIGLLTGALFPCAERVVEPCSALQRSLVYNNGFAQGWRFIRALISARGNKPVCRLHIHLAEINGLSAAGWRLTWIELAQLLLLNPQLKGVVGACWFYDPDIGIISPKLSFIKEQLIDIQASWFFSHNETEQSGAFVRSASRKQAFLDGHYQPRNYVIFIPRARLLTWYKRQNAC